MTPTAAQAAIVRATIRHYFAAKSECVPGLPYGYECTLCNSVRALKELIGEIGLREMIGEGEAGAIQPIERKE